MGTFRPGCANDRKSYSSREPERVLARRVLPSLRHTRARNVAEPARFQIPYAWRLAATVVEPITGNYTLADVVSG